MERGTQQDKNLALYWQSLQFFQEYRQVKTSFLQLLDELERTRKNWEYTETRCQNLEIRCKLLEQRLKMEKADKERIEKHNMILMQELNSNNLKTIHEEEHQRCRKRSIDFRGDENEPTIPRKSRRSSSVPIQNIANSAPCRREPLTIDINVSLEHQTKRKRRSLESENALDMVVSRQHVFVSKRNFLSGFLCDHCKESIRFSVLFLKCNACKLSYHEGCSRKLDMPCLPRLITPKRNDQINLKALRLADYCPETRPMIPHLIVHCIMHLEKMICPSVLYTTLGDDAKAAKLLSDFKNQRNVPDLSEYDTPTIAGCVMMFLMQIRDPLIMFSSHQEFFKASNDKQFIESINSLPTTHRDTLVYLVNHWKRVCDSSFSENFNTEILCNSLGPIVFGTSRQIGNVDKNEQARAVLLKILNLPFDSLKKLLNQDDSSFKGTLTRHDSDSRKNKLLITLKTN